MSPTGDAGASNAPRRRVVPIAVALLVMLALGAWIWWTRTRADAADAEQRQRLQAALDRGRSLAAELASIKPPDAPQCPPGQSLKTFAPGAVLPSLPASAPARGAGNAPSASSAPSAGAASVLPDYALAQQMENVTAMVLVDEGGSLSGGTGFFIAPNLLVTNHHVVGQPGSRLLLVSKSLGSPRRATLLKVTEGTETGSADFALVRMDDGTAPSVIEVAAEIGKLAPVVAAGYPGVVLRDDANFQRLLRGDRSAAPDLNLTQGTVQSLQSGAGGTLLLVHTASIAKGNSGGPLVDACGRLVGINTYIALDNSQSAKINYAIRSESMSTFLAASGTRARLDARPCGARR